MILRHPSMEILCMTVVLSGVTHMPNTHCLRVLNQTPLKFKDSRKTGVVQLPESVPRSSSGLDLQNQLRAESIWMCRQNCI